MLAVTPSPLVEDLRLVMPAAEGVVPVWLIGLIAVVLMITVWFILRPRRKREVPSELPADRAMRQLDEARGVIDHEPGVTYLRAVSNAVREYIEGRFGVQAPRQTTREFLESAARAKSLTAYRGKLGDFLSVCDEGKFAGTQVTSAEREAMHAAAVAFVKATRHSSAEVTP